MRALDNIITFVKWLIGLALRIAGTELARSFGRWLAGLILNWLGL